MAVYKGLFVALLLVAAVRGQICGEIGDRCEFEFGEDQTVIFVGTCVKVGTCTFARKGNCMDECCARMGRDGVTPCGPNMEGICQDECPGLSLPTGEHDCGSMQCCVYD